MRIKIEQILEKHGVIADTDYEVIAEELLDLLSVVGQSEQLKAEVFTLANKLAVAGEGDAAVAMHKIHNSL